MNSSSNTSYLVTYGHCVPLSDVVDSDVAGWGVITAFTAAIAFNIFAIVMGYFLRALPRDRYNPVDDWFLGLRTTDARHDASATSNNPHTTHRDDNSTDQTSSMSASRNSFSESSVAEAGPKPDNTTRRGGWTGALEPFVLGMSDQQLFTGMALMTATMFMVGGLHGLDESLSVYTFQVVTVLAYFSCIIHLCSLTVVRKHFEEHRRLGYFRASLMLLFLALLIPCMFVSESVTFRFNPNVSVKCALQNFRLVDPQRPGYANVSDEAIIIFNLVVLISIILVGYYRRLNELFNREATKPESKNGFWFLQFLHNFHSSFLSEVIWMFFYFVFGLSNLCKFFTLENAEVGAIKPGFGQLVPIFLLVHPFLSAFAALSGSKSATPRASTSESESKDEEPDWLEKPNVTLLLIVLIYTSVLMIWALMFAAIIPGAYSFSACACLFAVWSLVEKCFQNFRD